MSLQHMMNACLRFAFDSRVIKTLAGKGLTSAVDIIHQHFTLSAFELEKAFQDSFGYATSAIGLGLAPDSNSQKIWQKLLIKSKAVTQSKVSKEFATQIVDDYLLPYTHKKKWNRDTTQRFRLYTMSACLRLSKVPDRVFPKGTFSQEEITGLFSGSASTDAARPLIAHIKTTATFNPLVLEFLAYNQLIENAIRFFFREQLRKDERLEKTFAALQREGLWADMRNSQQAQRELSQAIAQKMTSQQRILKELQNKIGSIRSVGNESQLKLLTQRENQLRTRIKAVQMQLDKVPELVANAQRAWLSTDESLRKFAARFDHWGALLDTRLDTLQQSVATMGADIARTLKSSQEAAREARSARLAADRTARKVDQGVSAVQKDVAQISRKMDHLIKESQDPSPDVFISHAYQDHALALEVTRHLARAGLKVWLDPFEAERGRPIKQIEQAVKMSKIQVILCSNAAMRADQVKQQTLLAWKYQRPYIPLIAEPIRFKDQLNYWVDGRPLIEMTGPKSCQWIGDLVKTLRQACKTPHAPGLDLPTSDIRPTLAKPDLAGLRSIAKFTDRIWPLPAGKVSLTRVKQRDLGAPQDNLQHGHTIGSRVALAIESDREGYLTLLDEGPSGTIYCLCPSVFAPDPLLAIGRTYLPQKSSAYNAFVVTGNPGREHLLAVISEQPLGLDWMPRSPEIPARVLDASDIEALLAKLRSMDSGSWTALSSYFDVTT